MQQPHKKTETKETLCFFRCKHFKNFQAPCKKTKRSEILKTGVMSQEIHWGTLVDTFLIYGHFRPLLFGFPPGVFSPTPGRGCRLPHTQDAPHRRTPGRIEPRCLQTKPIFPFGHFRAQRLWRGGGVRNLPQNRINQVSGTPLQADPLHYRHFKLRWDTLGTGARVWRATSSATLAKKGFVK